MTNTKPSEAPPNTKSPEAPPTGKTTRTDHEATHFPTNRQSTQLPTNGQAQTPTTEEATHILTNRKAATRLRTLMSQLTQEPPPPLSTRLVKRLTPTPEESHLLSLHDDHEEAAA